MVGLAADWDDGWPQGCRPISDQTFTISKLKRNLIVEVTTTRGGRLCTSTPLRALQGDLDALGPSR